MALYTKYIMKGSYSQTYGHWPLDCPSWHPWRWAAGTWRGQSSLLDQPTCQWSSWQTEQLSVPGLTDFENCRTSWAGRSGHLHICTYYSYSQSDKQYDIVHMHAPTYLLYIHMYTYYNYYYVKYNFVITAAIPFWMLSLTICVFEVRAWNTSNTSSWAEEKTIINP